MNNGYDYSACMTVVVGPVTPTLVRPVLSKPGESLNVAGGISQGAKVGLFSLKFNNFPLISAFIYPYNYNLIPARIHELDGVFSEAQPAGLLRMFKDVTMEQLRDAFLNITRSEPPFTSYDYSQPVPVIHYGFPRDLEAFLKEKVKGLKI